MRRKDILDIVKVLLDHLEEEEMCDLCGFEYEEDLWDECEEDEEWEEVTEHVKDNSPDALKDRIEFLERTLDTTREDRRFYWENYERVQEENEHLRDLISMLCDTFGLEKYYTGWKLAVSWDKGLIEEIAKARKKLRK